MLGHNYFGRNKDVLCIKCSKLHHTHQKLGMKRRHHSKETRLKLSLANLGKHDRHHTKKVANIIGVASILSKIGRKHLKKYKLKHSLLHKKNVSIGTKKAYIKQRKRILHILNSYNLYKKFRVVPLGGFGFPIPDGIIIYGDNIKVTALEVGNFSLERLVKYNKFKEYYDDVLHVPFGKEVKQMAIVDVSNIRDFNEWMSRADKTRYRLIITEQNEVILRPLVSTRPLDTIVFRNVNREDIKKIESSWGAEILHCKKIHWDEERFLKVLPELS